MSVAGRFRQSRFTSSRERRLWVWTVVVVAAIYATLGLARSLADVLRNEELLGGVFFVAFLAALTAVGILGLKRRPRTGEIGVLLGVAAVYLMAFSRLGVIEERTHLFEYTIVAVLIHEALKERIGQGRAVRFPALIAIGATAALGWLDEGIQAILPNRVYDIRDVFFNVFAGVMAVGASVALARVRGSGRSDERPADGS